MNILEFRFLFLQVVAAFMICAVSATLKLKESKLLSEPLTNFQFHNGLMYIGGRNKIYALDKNLNINSSISTCSGNGQNCDNINKVLVVDTSRSRLVTCGTGKGGICELRHLNNLTSVETLYLVVSNDTKRPAVGMITSKAQLVIAVTFGNGIKEAIGQTVGYQTYKSAISTIDFSPLSVKKKLNLQIHSTVGLKNYIIYYKKCLQDAGFSYFVTIQKKNVQQSSNEYISKFIRICQNDTDYSSYADIGISCEGGYNFIQDAILVNSESGSKIFMGIFTKSLDPDRSSGDSVICGRKLEELDDAINQAKKTFFISGCYDRANKNKDHFFDKDRYLPSEIPSCPNNESLFEPKDFKCETAIKSFRYVTGNETYKFTTMFRLPADDGIFTSLNSTVLSDNSSVILAGTSTGKMIMMNFKDMSLTQYEMMFVDSGSTFNPVRAIHQEDDDTVYVMTTDRISKFASSNCNEFTTCEATMIGRNPLCGWCVLKNRATRKSGCSTENKRWLSSLTECAQLDLYPKGIIAAKDSTGGSDIRKITIVAKNIPKTEEDTYKCAFINGSGTINETQASRSDDNFTCDAPKVSSHTNAVLSLVVAHSNKNIILAKADFLFYECQTYKKCGECLNTVGAHCTWDLNNAVCVDYSDSHIKNDSACPRLENKDVSNFIPTSVNAQVTFNATNIPENAKMWCYVPKNGENISAPQHGIVNRTGDSLSCYLTITSSIPSKGQELRVLIKYGGNKAEFSEDLAEFDDDHNNTVTVYSCTELGEDCSHCKALKSRYDCKWCSGECQYKNTDCSDTCPAPRVTKIVPRDGPRQGGTKVTIYGEELGSNISDINNVTVADTLCNSTDFGIQLDEYFEKGVLNSIVCTTGIKGKGSSDKVIVIVNRKTSTGKVSFSYKNVAVKEISPKFGPVVGGTQLTIYGENLGVGNRDVVVVFGPNICLDANVKPNISLESTSNANFTIECKIKNIQQNQTLRDSVTTVTLGIDGTYFPVPVNFTFLPNPEIEQISPKRGTVSGGTGITVTGKNMKNTHVARISGKLNGEILNSDCEIHSSTKTVCRAPKAPESVKDMIKELIKSPRTKRSDCNECIEVIVKVYLDGFENEFTLTYFRDPIIHDFEAKDNVHLFSDENKKLTIRGEYINLVAQATDVNITIGLETCSVFELKENLITCLAPKGQPASVGKAYPEVNVTIGNYHKTVGYLEYEKTLQLYLIIGGVVGGVLLAIIVIGIVIVCYKYKKVGRKAKEYERNLSDMEMEIKRVAREEFLDMHTTMSTVNKNLVEQGFPYHSYQQFACNVMFSVDYLWTEPVVSNGKMTDDERLKANKGMETLESLISNKFFLVSVITTMENEKRFFIREKSNLAGNLCAVLMGRMDYLNEILKLLMTNLVQESSAKKHKTLFRRCESITEKLLSNWLSLCLYPHVKSHSGSPLYLLYMATQKTMESGPIDAVTCDAKYTLSEEKLLKKWSSSVEEDGDHDLKFEAKTLTLNVVVDNGEEIFKCKALDCDTISQVKTKCLNQIYVNYPASQLPVGGDELALEWHEGFGGALKLRDEDNTSKHDGHWVRLNTLAHYNVKDESNMALIDPHSAENNMEDYVNLANINMDGVCDGSIDSSQPLTPHDEENPHDLDYWHLVKKEEESSKQGKSAIAELYLNRLFTTKQSLMEYMRPLFDLILDHDRCPPPTKFLYDFLDELGEKNRVETETVHAWKSHSYAIRVWASLMKMPNTLFDVKIPPYMDENLSIISQVFIESFSLASQKFTKDSPSQKLIFHHEMNHYRERVKEFYKNVKVDSQNSDEYRQYLAEVNRLQQQTNFNKISALYRFYKQLKPYFEDILENLAKSKEASTLHLDRKLEQVIAIMEEED